jgi:hypothetical protein
VVMRNEKQRGVSDAWGGDGNVIKMAGHSIISGSKTKGRRRPGYLSARRGRYRYSRSYRFCRRVPSPRVSVRGLSLPYYLGSKR